MKRILFVLCLLLPVPAVADELYPTAETAVGGSVSIGMDDDTAIEFGDGTDCWFVWSTTGTDHFELKCTDVDGGGTDGQIFYVNTGTDDVVWLGTGTWPNTGIHILDTNATHDLILAPGSDLTADHTLTLTTGDADRTLSLSGNLTVEATSLINQDLTSDAIATFAGLYSGLYLQPTQTSDTAADAVIMHGGNAYEEATGASQSGAALELGGGIGTRQVTIDDYNNCGTDTVTVTIDGSATVCTEAGGGCTWTAATDNATTATSLAAAIDALSGVSASATGAVVYIVPDDGTLTITLAEGDATCTTLTQGTDGYVNVAGTLQFGGGTTARLSAANDAKLVLTNAAATADVCLDVSTDSALGLYAGDCSSAGTIRTSFVYDATGAQGWDLNAASTLNILANNTGYVGIRMRDKSDSVGMLVFQQNTSSHEFIASSGMQYVIDMGGSGNLEIAQTGTAALTLLHMDVPVITTTGSGQSYIINGRWGGADKFQVEDDGDVILAGGNIVNTPSSDTAQAGASSITVTQSLMRVVGDGGAQTLGDPNINTTGIADGTQVCIQGTSDVNTVTLQDENTNDGSQMELAGDVSMVLGENDIICLIYDSGEARWLELYRADNTDAE